VKIVNRAVFTEDELHLIESLGTLVYSASEDRSDEELARFMRHVSQPRTLHSRQTLEEFLEILASIFDSIDGQSYVGYWHKTIGIEDDSLAMSLAEMRDRDKKVLAELIARVMQNLHLLEEEISV
jgi:arabinogalactan endo-1,4-beta-galactosidase